MKHTILWDFDGVILNSMSVRDLGFRMIFEKYPKSKVEELIQYHRINGGLSRYVKIRYFYEEILKLSITEKLVTDYAQKFSEIMKVKLIDTQNLIEETVVFIKKNHSKYNFHIVSGSDQVELRYLCQKLDISQFFITIEGSPTPKNLLVKNLLNHYQYKKSKVCLIGDSLNDYEAAASNNIDFIAFNAPSLIKYNTIDPLF